MQTGQAQVVRSPWYDRSPLAITKTHTMQGNLVGETVRWSYTVPANRAARIDSLVLDIFKGGAAATANDNDSCYFKITPSGGAAAITHQTAFNSGSVDTRATVNVSPGTRLSAGDKIEYFTAASAFADNEIWYHGSMQATEYDA